MTAAASSENFLINIRLGKCDNSMFACGRYQQHRWICFVLITKRFAFPSLSLSLYSSQVTCFGCVALIQLQCGAIRSGEILST